MRSSVQARCRMLVMIGSGESQKEASDPQFLPGAPTFPGEVLSQGKYGENVSGKVEIAVDIGFAQRDLPVRAKNRPKSAGMIDLPGEAAKLAWVRGELGTVP